MPYYVQARGVLARGLAYVQQTAPDTRIAIVVLDAPGSLKVP